MDISVTIITSFVVALIYVFIIKPKKDKKAAEMKESQTEGKTEKWIDDYDVEFSPDKETLLKAPTSLKEYTIPNGVISIRSNAFDGCSNLMSVTFPNSVKQIGRFVFNKCDSLSAIHIPAGNKERFKRILPTDLHSILIEPNTTTPEKESRGKLMRPKFTDEEALAMGRLAVSIVGSRINQPEAMIKFSMEYEGYTMGDIRAMTNMGMPEFLKSVSVFSSMLDPIKKSYAAGFFAAIIKACGCENDSTVYTAYKNCLDNVLRIGGMDDLNVAAGFYEGCEQHGKR